MDIVFVTDRHLIPVNILSDQTPEDQGFDLLEGLVGQAFDHGVDRVILREKDLDKTAYEHLLRRILKTTSDRTQVSVHTHVDLAIAHGVSLHMTYQDYIALPTESVEAVRQNGGVVGCSIHKPSELSLLQNMVQAAEKASGAMSPDYLLLGTLFETTCKPGIEGGGLSLVEAFTTRTQIPLIGIGGIQPEHVSQLGEAGLKGVAVRSGFMVNPGRVLDYKAYL